jgi:SpoIID/LytB domain protein
MRERIDCFLPCDDLSIFGKTLDELRKSQTIQHINLLVSKDFKKENPSVEDCHLIEVDNLSSSKTMLQIEASTDASFVLLSLKGNPFQLGYCALERFLRVASDEDAAMVFADHYSMEGNERRNHPVIDYQKGSLRDEFDFGQLVLIKASLLHEYVLEQHPDYQYAGFYDLRLFLSRNGELFHLNESLYTEQESGLKKSGESQFDYVNPNNREVQLEMEKAVTEHLRKIGALIDTSLYEQPDFSEQDFEVEASVIIPVLNREKTIADALNSALEQKTTFPFNVIVIDNHSHDKTPLLIDQIAVKSKAIYRLLPERVDLGIGGCWNLAVNDEHCGRIAVQLDSDDLFSSPKSLQRIVEKFHKEKLAMVVGSYRLCDFHLNTLPPGLIEHREWTEENGCNNLLRVNGIGAPRAFFTPLIRQIGFPNVSYGEDYAVGLVFSRRYRIGRIFEELSISRRWEGNSDHELNIEQINANNLYKDRIRTLEVNARQQMLSGKDDIMAYDSLQRFFNRQLEIWDFAREQFHDLRDIQTKELACGDMTLKVQYNPARMVSTGANLDKEAIAERPCFLCEKNRPKEQRAKRIDGNFEMLVNPFPILPLHFTIPARRHQPQSILQHYNGIHRILSVYSDLMVFYNGPKCGASAPDHLHFQGGTSGMLPLQTEWPRLSRNLEVVHALNEEENISVVKDFICPLFLIRSRHEESDESLFHLLYKALPMQEGDTEPMMNIVAWRKDDEQLSLVFPRKKHRPDCYFLQDPERLMISPGAIDMAGLFITAREKDFQRLTAEKAASILKEVCVSPEEMQQIEDKLRNQITENNDEKQMNFYKKEPEVSVGIVSGAEIHFTLNKPYLAKGEEIIGEQVAQFSEGSVLWNGNQYRELVFQPQSPDASFSLNDVTIGVNFHWERKETQTFAGTLHFVVEEDKICAINELPVEEYLESVISSEMSATSSLELLKAHAVISRSWLLAQMMKRQQLSEGGNNFFSFIKKEDELIRWYDREDHTIFDVCADDHCQRYQGITKETSHHVVEAIKATRGQILYSDGEICDARFSKSCGGVSEEYQYCWEDTPKSYLKAIRDDAEGSVPDLTIEANADKWIRSNPDAFCNTQDRKVLSQVLNDYDQETSDFYRWHVTYTQEQISELISRKLKMDFGKIIDLIPLERGKSGRLSKLKIVGSERTFTIGKELEIRRALSESHLYSSAFVVDKKDVKDGIPQSFELIGAGWGHGVGLCQIGAAVMGEKGYKYDEILLHYYKGAEIKKIYK